MLTLTATPIPRTLELSLTGIRDLSLVNTPPEDRQPILTYVGEYDDRAVAEAIRRELLREGQVFYVHNRVRDIELVAENVRALVPEARVAVAHGQMDENRLERVVLDFGSASSTCWCARRSSRAASTCRRSTRWSSTAPTCSGSRSCTSCAVASADGASARTRTCSTRADRVLSEEAYERLKTIGEFTDLGSGFKIAMRDLEIRGAGNLLGQAQSGHIAAVGFDLYCQMVTEAVGELKGEPVRGARRDHDRRARRRQPAARRTCSATTCAWRPTAASRR